VSALSLFPPSFFDRANRGLLVEARAPEEAAASLATGTKRRSASLSTVALAKVEALAAMQPTNGAKRPEEGRGWCGGMEDRGRPDN
jgi:hypothetical protein